MTPLQRKPTITDVARVAGVGIMTVSRVLNESPHVSEETAKRVLAAIEKLAYRPNEMARSLRSLRSRTIGVLLPNLHDTFFAVCAHALNMVAKEYEYTVLLALTNDDSEHEYQEARRMMQRHVEGLVVIPADSARCKLGEREFSDIPVLALDRPLTTLDAAEVDSVLTENEAGACMAIDHLVQVHNARRILFLGYRQELYTVARRAAGYRAAMQAAKLRPMEDFGCASEATTIDLLRKAFQKKTPPQAIFSANNMTTRYALSALLRLGLEVPSRVALVGFDDLELGDLLHPALTVIRQPVEELGRTAGRMLFAKIRETAPTEKLTHVVLPVELLVRHSCGCAYSRATTSIDTYQPVSPVFTAAADQGMPRSRPT